MLGAGSAGSGTAVAEGGATAATAVGFGAGGASAIGAADVSAPTGDGFKRVCSDGSDFAGFFLDARKALGSLSGGFGGDTAEVGDDLGRGADFEAGDAGTWRATD
jgi:hypothetical protein